MNILCIDSACGGVTAVLKTKEKIFFKTNPSAKRASELLFVFVDELLREANLELKDLSYIGVVVGPGSFTGIRIGLTFAKTLNQTLNIPIVCVTSLEVLAYKSLSTKDSVVSAIDASSGLLYVAAFNKDKSIAIKPCTIKAAEVDNFLKAVSKPYSIVCGDENSLNAFKKHKRNIADKAKETGDFSSALLNATLKALENGETKTFSEVVPLYIRVSQAEANLV